MKTSIVFIILSVLVAQNFYSQTSNYDLYISLDSESEIKIVRSRDSLNYMTAYFLPIKECDAVNYNFNIDDNGTLLLNYKVKGHSPPIIKFEYLNENGNNKPFIVNKHHELNILRYDKHFYYNSFENLWEIIENARNLYIIEEDYDSEKDFFIVKKVNMSLL